ncbi:426_t:CDS:2 [Funneliformis caledonium]|uniref:ER membrane protein complex subunit 2 n=2 Tax=Funneliformis TaxID=1117308 RepID=A0A9N8YPU4_9GLOM|nr:426_t:CDS:2 [Funneliformis caledonium]CAG8547085.1 1793_t:CDS:2 [Funneliformis mosseae]
MVSFDYKTAVTTLQELRKSGERKSELVVFLGESLINRGYTGKLGDEVWSVYEQIFIAALDLENDQLTIKCLENLNKRFPGSPRVKILEGMKLEADDKLDSALALYEDILKEDEANIAASKRRIAVYKAKGQDGQAIDALTRYLDAVYNDAEAWLELSALYLNYHLYQQAGFCLEELILLQPQNHFYHLKYAEVLYTSDNIPVALKQFCRVLELCEDNIRALCGIKLCTSRLLNLSNISNASTSNSVYLESKTISDLNALAVERLTAIYSKNQHGGKTAIEIKNVVIDWLSQS